jgi:hypothetical protein
MRGVGRLHGRLSEVRVHFHLVERGNHRSPFQQGVEVPGHEVAHADRPHPPVGEQGLQGTVGLPGEVDGHHSGLVGHEADKGRLRDL